MSKSHKDFLSVLDFSKEEVSVLFKEAARLKKEGKQGGAGSLAGRTLALIMQKPSTRTTVSFAAGMAQLGGTPLILNSQELQLKRGESLSDTARTLSQYVDGIMIRANKQDEIEELARFASIPVINGLSDKEHPCQILSDIFTLWEARAGGKIEGLKGMKIAYLGDGNNVAHSLILAASLLGMEISVASPKGYEPEKEFVQKGKVTVLADPLKAAAGADVLYTDVWASMGKDEEREKRKEIFMPYQVNAALLAAASKDARVMHCLPAHRGEEITEEVMEGRQSIIFEQAGNRLHVQKAILLYLLKDL
ncbi:MAG: ornithine carbamoyltransferase [Elusimicrobia bacterium RIFCSPLOWO2_01_FULL_60_11]|nr:MAG: ornithine carbamoyltransferase [Elusimicrobia bacterium RIFCSPLOWO2_01_FULL_60_11]